MIRNRLIIGLFIGLFVVVVLIAFSVFRTPESASGPIVAPTLQAPSETANVENTTASPGVTPSQGSASQSAGVTTFQIVPESSESRFVVDEVLNGKPNTVVGTTSQVAGEIVVDFNHPAASQVGAVLINARDLTTDNNFRNRALKNQILDTNRYEFITFTPTEIIGLTGASAGGSANFQIVGDLMIKETTQQVTFDVTITGASPSQIIGTATATILYSDFGISIPRVPTVASVENEVRLELDFLAEAG
jgi:polyisoprenoid-binding protein YceI